MKRFRSSFSHLVREKIIKGQDDVVPSPETRDLPGLFPDIVANSAGTFEYQHADFTDSNSSGGVGHVVCQGPMGYGPPPIGDGELPYNSFLSNKINNNQRTNTYTGSSVQPSITFRSLHYTGFSTSFAVGQARQSAVVGDETRHIYVGDQSHALISVHGIWGAANGSYTGSDSSNVSNGRLDFCYQTFKDDNKQFKLYLEYHDTAGVQKQSAEGTEDADHTFVHFYTSYSRLLPVQFRLDVDGSFSFRVDTAVITGNISNITNVSDNVRAMPSSGKLGMTINGLNPSGIGVVPFGTAGVAAPVSRLTNVSLNDNDDTDGKGDVNPAPFIVGIPCTPIRYSDNLSHADDNQRWNLPLSVIDQADAWVSYSDTGTPAYGLSAVADSQMFETRGVAALSADGPLHVHSTNTNLLNSELSDRGLTGLEDVEAINSIVYKSTILESTNYLTLQIKNGDVALTDPKHFANLKDGFNNSHITHFYKNNGAAWEINDFQDNLIHTLLVDDDYTPPEDNEDNSGSPVSGNWPTGNQVSSPETTDAGTLAHTGLQSRAFNGNPGDPMYFEATSDWQAPSGGSGAAAYKIRPCYGSASGPIGPHELHGFGWVGQDFGDGNEKVITKYRIHPGGHRLATVAYHWKFQASNVAWNSSTESERVTLQEIINPNWGLSSSSSPGLSIADNIPLEFSFTNTTAYRYYRLVLLQDHPEWRTDTSFCTWRVMPDMEME